MADCMGPTFLSQLASPERWGRQVPVLVDGKEQATCTLGTASFLVQSQSTGMREFLMIPTAFVCREGCSVVVTGASPSETLTLALSSEAAASALQEQLQAIVEEVVLSLHLFRPVEGPPLSVKSVNRKKQTMGMCGQVRLVGYAVVGWLDRFYYQWLELCGPDQYGAVGVYCYDGHEKDARFLDDFCVSDTEVHMQGAVLTVIGLEIEGGARYPWEKTPDTTMVFRSPEEAQLWADVISATKGLNGQRQREHPLPQAARRAEEVASQIQRRAARALVPLLAEAPPRAPRETGPVDDDIARYQREKQQKRLKELAQAALEAFNMDDFGEGDAPQSDTTIFNPGTTNYNTTVYH